MEREWQELDVNNLPSDILAEEGWEFQYHHHGDGWKPTKTNHPHRVLALSIEGNRYRIRRPEGWGPKKCPTCGSDKKSTRNQFAINGNGVCVGDMELKCSDSWHDEPKAPTHEEILAPRFWKCDDGVWRKLIIYRPQSISARFGFLLNGKEWGVNEPWFINRQSADIPLEKS